jgi:hypothetical protein
MRILPKYIKVKVRFYPMFALGGFYIKGVTYKELDILLIAVAIEITIIRKELRVK